jgi:LPS-assembly protein
MLTFAFAVLLSLAPQQAGGNAKSACPDIQTSQGDPKVEGEKAATIIRGSGGCVVEYEDMRFESDWFEYNQGTNVVTAGDHIRFTRGTEDMEGTHLELNVKTKAGKIWDATGKVEPGFHVTAKVAERFEDESWEFQNTTITACESKDPCWNIVLGRAWYRPGEWVKGKSTIFHMYGLPLFWLPAVVAPSESKDRSTGFLIPSISKSNAKGWGYHDEFYIVINDSADASIVGEYYSQAGFTGEVNFRAKPTSSGFISVSSFFAKDLLNADVNKQDDIGDSLRILAFSNLWKHSRGVVDLETESSEFFRQMWGDSFNAIASPINRSVGYLTTNKPNSSFNFLYSRSEFLQTVSSTTSLPVNTSLRKAPSIEFSMPSHEFSTVLPVYLRLEASATGFSRRDEVITDSMYGERFDFHPSMQMPLLRTNAFELSQEFGVRDTLYSHSLQPAVENESLNRFTMEYAARFSGPEFSKSYGIGRHSIQPTLDYRYVTGVNQFRDTIIVDDVDLVANTSELEYGVTNRIMGERELLNWRVAQVAYFRPDFGGAIKPDTRNVFNPLLGLTGFSFADGPRKFSPIVSTLSLSPNPVNTFGVQVDYDTQLKKLRSTGVLATLRKRMWGSSLSYVYNAETAFQAANNQLHGSLSYGNGLNRGLSFATAAAYDMQTHLFQGATVRLGYNTECYGLSFEITDYNLGARQEHKWRLAFSLKNIGTFGNMRPQDRVF